MGVKGRQIMGLWVALGIGVGSPVWAQCPQSAPPIQTLLQELKVDTARIFKKLGIETPPSGAATAAPTIVEADHLIVPAKRVGPYEIDSSPSQLKARISFGSLKSKLDPRYTYILPLGYVPERFVAEPAGLELRFAFLSEHGPLSEIFVRSPKFSTETGVRVGSPVSSLSREGKLERKKSKDGVVYYQGSGITYLTDEKEVLEIVVVRQLKGRP